jgi:tetratricopeptide (TPR) repeat protein
MCLTVAVYRPALHNGFTNADDPAYVTDNPLIRDLSPHGARQIFTTFYEGYHPLTLLTFAVEYQWAGLNPASYHATNIVLHMINVLLVMALVRRLTPSPALPYFVAALFAVHPLHVESVAWIAERKNVLYAAFYLAGLIAYHDYARAGGARTYLRAFALALLAALSNGKAIAFVLSIAALDLLLARRLRDWRLWLEKVPFAALALAFGITNIFSQRAAGYLYSIVDFTRFEHFLTGCRNLLMYAVKLLAPVGLVHQYPYPERIGAWLPLTFYAAPVVLLAALAFFIARWRRSPLPLFCALFYLVNLLLVAKFLPFAGVMMEDHFAYMPSIGLFLLVGCAMRALALRTEGRALRVLLASLLALWILVLAGVAHQRTKVWKDGVTLWSDVLSKYPRSPRGFLNRGAARGAAGDLAGAVADYRQAMSVMPDNAPIHFNLGNILLQGGQVSSAVSEYDAALRLDPAFAPAHFYRGVAHDQAGRIDEAIADYSKAIAMGYFSHLTHPRFRRAVLLARKDRLGEALLDLNDTLKSLQSADALYYRSHVLDRMGRHAEAKADYMQATRLSTDCPPELVPYFATHAAFGSAASP